MYKHILIAPFCAAIIGGFGVLPAQAQETGQVSRQNSQIATFYDVDIDRSGFLESGEYRSYAFGQADWDKDGQLENTEWASYTRRFYDPYGLDYDSMTYYDTDGDGFIDMTEFNEFPTRDLFTSWDYDRDSRINSTDWDKVTAFYSDNG